MQIKLVKFGTPVQWAKSTETYLETGKHKCKMEFKDSLLQVTNDAGDLLLVTIGNIAYMQAAPSKEKRSKDVVGEQAAG
jgi:hypothetical protein